MTGLTVVLVTTFLASSVEAIEMVTIVVGVGATRGWRATLIGTLAGFGVLVVAVVVLGAALSAIPIGPLRVLVGAVLLLFGLQWFRKGIVRVATNGLAGYHWHEDDDERVPEGRFDWVAFLLAFKGVVLEGLEIAFIVVSFGATARMLGPAVVAGAAAIAIIGGLGFVLTRWVGLIPRSLLQLIVGTMLASFGSFWALEGLGVEWPQSDLDIAGLLLFYAGAAVVLIGLERRARRLALGVAHA